LQANFFLTSADLEDLELEDETEEIEDDLELAAGDIFFYPSPNLLTLWHFEFNAGAGA
jgi:hypothetical protein